jgi:hypothetical protein
MSENIALIGADPEAFVCTTKRDRNGRVNYNPQPIYGLLGGSKDAPNPMNGLDQGYAYLEDNAAVEFNIPPQTSSRNFVGAISLAKRWIEDNKLSGLGLTWHSSNQIELAPKYKADPRGQVVGCSKDWDAYGMTHGGTEREAFSADTLGDWRYSGGHFHVSYNHKVIPHYVAARVLDLYVTLPFLSYDKQGGRRKVYGKAGLYRPKEYGIEYRTPSNWWLWYDGHQAALANAILTFAHKSYDAQYLNTLSDMYSEMPWGDVQKAIENEDVKAAHVLIDLADNNFNMGIFRATRGNPGRAFEF